MLEPRELDKFYSYEYYGPDHHRFNRAAENTILLFRRARAIRIMRMIPSGGAVLDVGCGRGVFLDILAKHGYHCLGTERSETSGCDAKELVKIMIGNIEDINLPDESFDMVTFWQVLEHLHNPKNAIAEASRILRPGGKILIQVPNPESLQARTGPYWFHLDPPRHLTSCRCNAWTKWSPSLDLFEKKLPPLISNIHLSECCKAFGI